MKQLISIVFIVVYSLINNCVVNAQKPIVWQKSYNTYGPAGFEGINSIVQTPDSGYIVVGNTRPSGGGSGSYMMAMRINKYGDSLWLKYYDFVVATKIIKTSDDNYLIVSNFSDLVKININGDTIWTKRAYLEGVRTYSLKETSDKGFIVAGESEPSFIVPYILKTDSSGNLQWQKEYLEYPGAVTDVIEEYNRFTVCGYWISPSPPFVQYTLLMKIDAKGTKVYENSLNIKSYPISIVKSADSKYVIAGTGKPIQNDGNSAFLLKLDTLGNLVWHKTYDPGNPITGSCNEMIIANDGGYALMGTASRDSVSIFAFTASLIKTDSEGNVEFRKKYGFDSSTLLGKFIKQTYDDGYIFGGSRDEEPYNYHIIKTDSTGYAPPVKIINLSNEIPSGYVLFQNYPNPFNPITKIKFAVPKKTRVKIEVYNSLGKISDIIAAGVFEIGLYEITYIPKNLSSGVYFYKFITSELSITKKFVYLK